ncbi:hypothetical protein GGR54DRAFT_649352 [Hypoxylon sp. NC1633]|nr:hypothetical protein GGR54DRAFT_649352 [Hypoxylon sp. NC1633]
MAPPRPVMENLPPETVKGILEQMPDFKTLLALTAASPLAHRVFHNNESVICKEIITRIIGRNLPIAVARFQASVADWKPTRPLLSDKDPDEYHANLTTFCNTYLAEHQQYLAVPLQFFTLEVCVKMKSFHTCVLNWVVGMSTAMTADMNVRELYYWRDRELDDSEKQRITKTLYVTELVSILLPIRYGPRPPPGQDRDWKVFWMCFAPWEFCQWLEMSDQLAKNVRQYLRDEQYVPYDEIIFYQDLNVQEIPGACMLSYESLPRLVIKTIVLQAGLEALETTMYGRYYIVHPTTSALPHIVSEVIRNCWLYGTEPARCFDNSRYIRVVQEYLDFWMQPVQTAHNTLHRVNTANLFERYPDIDQAPLVRWLYDLLCFGQPRVNQAYALHPSKKAKMTSFWSQRRWATAHYLLYMNAFPYSSHVEHMLNLAASRALTGDNELVFLPNI